MAAGPIVWDQVSVGGYTIQTQALCKLRLPPLLLQFTQGTFLYVAAANEVQSEPLAPNFSGILGLALPLNSIIASTIPPVITNEPDGAAWASNLFSITPAPLAPASRFLSLSLSRPGSDTVPSFLGIGRHPAALVPDPSKIEYDTLVSERSGTLFWKTSVRAISVWVGGEERQVRVGRSNTNTVRVLNQPLSEAEGRATAEEGRSAGATPRRSTSGARN
ncbi:hypothetical protein B0H34DRAFT_156009 [Crassisporium funariophilum]|nr:hypothetical protein B0H34DRAFT_156009 [Crassisporium funariophilum]